MNHIERICILFLNQILLLFYRMVMPVGLILTKLILTGIKIKRIKLPDIFIIQISLT